MSTLLYRKDVEQLDYAACGLVAGLEIHQQLDTGKLFCSCPSSLVQNDVLDRRVYRRLRFSQSETGSVDTAAMHEFQKGKYHVYAYNDAIACLVELDEEPPRGPNPRALDTALQIGMMLDMKFYDKIQFMRKLIIDGSITSGFQRTATLGTGGVLPTEQGEVSIDSINLEEDASRAIERSDAYSLFSLDRQGIPLVEITTGPHMYTPQAVHAVATELGSILRSFSSTKRGLGTIRQDLNVSISGGARVEIKGAQNLKLIPQIIDNEIRRQLIHRSIISTYAARGGVPSRLSEQQPVDVTSLFNQTQSQMVYKQVSKGAGVFAIRLPGCAGLLGHELQEDVRLATEVASRLKQQLPAVKGLFHSDELPGYGMGDEEVSAVREQLGLQEGDGFAMIVQEPETAISACRIIASLLHDLLTEIPTEVRQVDPKGTRTMFLRPMPGSARMYPETDIPEVPLASTYVKSLQEQLPERYDRKLERLSEHWSLSSPQLEEILGTYHEEEVQRLLQASKISAQKLYQYLFEVPKDIKRRESLDPIDLKVELLEDLLSFAAQNNLNQQTIRDIFVSLYRDRKTQVENLETYLKEKQLLEEPMDESQVRETIRGVVAENPGAPFSALMGKAMKALGGKADGKTVSRILHEEMDSSSS